MVNTVCVVRLFIYGILGQIPLSPRLPKEMIFIFTQQINVTEIYVPDTPSAMTQAPPPADHLCFRVSHFSWTLPSSPKMETQCIIRMYQQAEKPNFMMRKIFGNQRLIRFLGIRIETRYFPSDSDLDCFATWMGSLLWRIPGVKLTQRISNSWTHND